MEAVSRPELPPLLLLPLPLEDEESEDEEPEDEEPEVGVEEEGAAPKRVSVFVAAAPVGKSTSVETGDVSCWYTLESRSLGWCSE